MQRQARRLRADLHRARRSHDGRRPGVVQDLSTYTYIYQAQYGSPEVDGTTPSDHQESKSAADGKSVRLFVDRSSGRPRPRAALDGVRSAAGKPLLHPVAYYTLNYIPKIGRPLPRRRSISDRARRRRQYRRLLGFQRPGNQRLNFRLAGGTRDLIAVPFAVGLRLKAMSCGIELPALIDLPAPPHDPYPPPQSSPPLAHPASPGSERRSASSRDSQGTIAAPTSTRSGRC